MKVRLRHTVIAAILVGVGLAYTGPAASAVTAGSPHALLARARIEPPPAPVTWWNAGDSYASGEGTSGAAGYCQQSDKAFGPKTVAILTQQRSWNIPSPVFSACTGHTAMDQQLSKEQQRNLNIRPTCKAPDSKIDTRPAGNTPDDKQSLQTWAKAQPGWPVNDNKFDVITMSFGGNDICFSETIIGCLGAISAASGIQGGVDTFLRFVQVLPSDGRCEVTLPDMEARVDALFAGGITRLTENGGAASLPDLWALTEKDYLAPNGVLVVVGYPRLFTPSSTWGAWRGGRCNSVAAADADMLGTVAEYLDQKMAAAVAGLDAGRGRIKYVSRLALFDANGSYHALCGKGVEWLNTELLFLRDGSLRKERGFHPNDLGHSATAEQVAGVVADTEAAQAAANAPQATSPPADATPVPVIPIESGDQTFEVGSRFTGRCTIAWPTAPSIGIDSISMTTTCDDQPPQFLFVRIVYGDPNLAVSPNHATMDVQGTVIDIVRNQLGFTTLVIQADQVTVV